MRPFGLESSTLPLSHCTKCIVNLRSIVRDWKCAILFVGLCHMLRCRCIGQLYQGPYKQVCVKFKDFSSTSKRLSYCFQGLKTNENTDLHVKILFLKCSTAWLKLSILENKYKIVVPLFGAAYPAPNKSTTILYWFRSPKTVLIPSVNGKIEGLFKDLSVFQVLYEANLNNKDFPRQSYIFK